MVKEASSSEEDVGIFLFSHSLTHTHRPAREGGTGEGGGVKLLGDRTRC